jgi:hypothetical protein
MRGAGQAIFLFGYRTRVRLKSRPFAGLEGILPRRKENFRVVLPIELIQRSVVVDADTLTWQYCQLLLKTLKDNSRPRQ